MKDVLCNFLGEVGGLRQRPPDKQLFQWSCSLNTKLPNSDTLILRRNYPLLPNHGRRVSAFNFI